MQNDASLCKSSGFSIIWDLMQVVLLMWVLVSVPFAIAFDVDVVRQSPLWWWELWVDTYLLRGVTNAQQKATI